MKQVIWQKWGGSWSFSRPATLLLAPNVSDLSIIPNFLCEVIHNGWCDPELSAPIVQAFCF